MTDQNKQADPFDSLGGRELPRGGAFWEPAAGQFIVGTLKDIREPAPNAKIKRAIAEIDAGGDKVMLVGLNPDLSRQLSRELIGHRVGIQYTGDLDTGGQSAMKQYRVRDLGAA